MKSTFFLFQTNSYFSELESNLVFLPQQEHKKCCSRSRTPFKGVQRFFFCRRINESVQEKIRLQPHMCSQKVSQPADPRGAANVSMHEWGMGGGVFWPKRPPPSLSVGWTFEDAASILHAKLKDDLSAIRCFCYRGEE